MTAAVAVEHPAPPLDQGAILAKAAAENFPVALRVLARQQRSSLMAIYGYARFVDDVGDLVEGDRTAQLDWVEAELDRALAGEASHPIFVQAGELARRYGIGRRPFADLIAANRQDQVVRCYRTFDELVGYCALSANPVGRLVLAVFGLEDATCAEWSDEICTALQVIEHLQDVAEDRAAGRVYLPLEDLDRFGVPLAALDEPSASPALRRLVAFECGRARSLLRAGRPLVRRASGGARLALAGFVGGGLAQLEAIEAVEYDVLGRRAKASPLAVARWSGRALRATPAAA